MTRLVTNFDVGWLWSLAGWTMLHYLWTGLVLLLFATAGRLLLRHTVPQIRYVYAIGWLVLLTILPIGIAGRVAAQLSQAPPDAIAAITSASTTEASGAGPIIELHVEPRDINPAIGALAPIDALPGEVERSDAAAIDLSVQSQPQRQSPGQAPWFTVQVENFCCAVAGYLPWLWLAGAPLTFALLATGLVGVERLSRQSRPLADDPIVALCADLARSFGIGRRVAVGVCEHIRSPILVGILRPLILLPPAALTGWSPQQLEMVLLHELAHVRRWDNLVNLVQRLIESVLFFQPAVWIVSHWVRVEREHCCDAAVVLRTQRPTEYAQTLATLATAHVSPAEVTRIEAGPVSAMAQRQLVRRIRHILDQEREPMQVSRKTLAGIPFAVLLTIATASLLPSSAVQADPETDNLAADVTVAEGDSDSAAADKALLDLKKPPKPEPQPETSTDKATAADLDLREAQLNYDMAKQKHDLTFQHYRSGELPQLSTLEATRELKLAEIALERAKRRIAGSDTFVGGVASAYPEPRRIVDGAEKQRIADLAWQMLGLDLEEISPDQLGKVSQRYDGGLRCINVDHRTVDILEGDVLLGLHIWETATFRQLAYVLTLPNITDLMPMKCYLLRGGKVYHARLLVIVPAGAGPRRGGVTGTGVRGSVVPDTTRPSRRNRTARQPTAGNGGESAEQPAAVDKSALRYDGKSFDQWRDQWRTELKPEERTEAIRAFAAFAKNGYSREAAEAIVEIMRNYDSSEIDNSPTGKLKEAAIEALVSIDPKVRDPVLVDALKSANRNATVFAVKVFAGSRSNAETVLPALRQVVENKEMDRRVRYMAVNAVSSKSTSEEAQQILIDACNDDDPVIVQGAIHGMALAGATIRDSKTYIARLIDAMGHSNGPVRRAAYRALGSPGIASKPAVPVLTKALQENKDNEELNMIVDTLGRIGTAAEEAVPALVELCKSNSRRLPEQDKLRVAILRALDKIAPGVEIKLPRERE